jgi:hypothetical protein
MHHISRVITALAAALAVSVAAFPAAAAKLTLTISGGAKVAAVGAFHRWDQDGNPRKKVNPKAKIDAPEWDYPATRGERGQWIFKDLPPGKYDLAILAGDRVRIEGFDYPPVLAFDPFFPPGAKAEEESRDYVIEDIKKSSHYENKVVPLYVGADEKNKTVRVLVMLVRDKETSYEADMPGAATIRHEVWQYTFNYGGWQKEKRTRVFDRAILARDDLRKWTWLWDPALGGVAVKDEPLTIEYALPAASAEKKLQGLYPY